jgi:hypothetical protein
MHPKDHKLALVSALFFELINSGGRVFINEIGEIGQNLI